MAIFNSYVKLPEGISSSLSKKTSSVILSDPCRWVLLVVHQIQEELASFGSSLIGCRPLRGSTRPRRLAKRPILVSGYPMALWTLEVYTVNISVSTTTCHDMPSVLLSHLRYAS